MDKTNNRWILSIREFKSLRTVVFCGMMCALGIILDQFSISFGPYIKVGFSGLPNRVTDYLFGPAAGAIFAGAMDIIKFMIKPEGDFSPVFTLIAMLASVIYALILYRKKLTLVRVIISQVLVKLIINIGLNTAALCMMYGSVLSAILPARIIRNAIMLPIDIFIMYTVLKAVDTTLKPMMENR